jgi:hypothetical protein
MIASNDRLMEAEQQQAEAMAELLANESAYASAVVVNKVYKERIEGLEMKVTAVFLRKGDTAAASKINALASPEYANGMKRIIDDLESAQQIITRDGLLHEKLNSAREIMANERKRIGL